MVDQPRDRQDAFPFMGGETWCRVVGDINDGVPLVMLHGGPGYPSYYLENLAQLANGQRAVIFYDQMSCGRSTGSINPADWTMDTFVEQFLVLLEYFNLETVDLLGQSWGGFLALEIALRHPSRLQHLILSSTSPSSQMFVDAATARLHELPPELIATIEKCDAAGDYDNADYRAANRVFIDTFCDRMDPQPWAIAKSDEHMNVALYRHMWGPTEFRCLGTLKDWDVSARLGEIKQPVLITSGAFDEAGPAIQEFMVAALPNARWECFPNSAHQSQLSDEQLFVEAVSNFLQ